MINLKAWNKAWALLDARERRNAWITLAVIIIGAMSSVLMIGSVMPFLSVLADPSTIMTVPALAWAYREFEFTNSYTFLLALGLASFTVIIIASLIQIAKTYAISRFSMMRIHSISHRLLLGYLYQPYAFFLNRHSGEMATRVLEESQRVVIDFLRPAAEMIAATLTVIAIVGFLFYLDPKIAAVAFSIMGGIYYGVYYFTRKIIKQYGHVRADENSNRFRLANEALSGIKDIKLLGRESAYAERYAFASNRMARAMVSIQVLSHIPQYALQAIALGGMILLCLAMMDSDGMTSGEPLRGILPALAVFAFAGQRLMPELSKLYQSLALLQAGSAAVDAVYEDIGSKVVKANSLRQPQPAIRLKKTLDLIDVSYSYPGSEFSGLKSVSLNFKAGEKIGIIGSTGAGKTTLVDLILGLLRPVGGQLVVDGMTITDMSVRSWQQSVGYVAQDIFLIDASVSENIALGVPLREIDQARVREAAKTARIDKFVQEEMPDGYSTKVGERGVRLSGGQRQRIGIARSLYHDADLIVFDEATSALDNKTERDVMIAIDELHGHKTILLVAHRLSTVKQCDRIVVLESGRLVGFDTWDALMIGSEAFRKIATVNDAVLA